MKRFLLVASLLLLQVSAFAGTISIAPFISGNDVTIARLETQRTTLQNVINGSIEGGVNIKSGSLVSADFSNAVSPVTRWSESFTNFVVSGMIAPTSVSLSSTTTAGTAYVDGTRVVVGSTAHTYTASKDTYVFIHSGGYYVYTEVSNGASQPSTPANTQVLFKAISSATAITTVTDLRQLGITLTSSANIVPLNYRDGMVVSRDSTTTITVQPGNLEVSSTRIAKTSATTLTLSSASDWAGGVSLRAVSTYGYVGSDISGNLKLHTTAPTHSDYGVATTAGKKRYATWSGTVYRIIGWFYMNSTSSGELDTYAVGNIKESDVANSIGLDSTTQFTSGSATNVSDTASAVKFYSSGGPVRITYNAGTVNDGANPAMFNISADSTGVWACERQFLSSSSTVTRPFEISIDYKQTLTQGTHSINGVLRAEGGTQYVTKRNLYVEEL